MMCWRWRSGFYFARKRLTFSHKQPSLVCKFMDDLNEAAPHTCPDCGHAAYIGLYEVKCTNKACPYYSEDLWVEWAMVTDDTGDPPKFETAPNPFRDFCSSCHTAQNFHRHRSPSGLLHAFCKDCGKPNVWGSSLFDDEDTEPQGFKSDLGAWLDDNRSDLQELDPINLTHDQLISMYLGWWECESGD